MQTVLDGVFARLVAVLFGLVVGLVAVAVISSLGKLIWPLV